MNKKYYNFYQTFFSIFACLSVTNFKCTDFFQISRNSSSAERFEGKLAVPFIITRMDSINITFYSDGSASYTGFQAEIYASNDIVIYSLYQKITYTRQ